MFVEAIVGGKYYRLNFKRLKYYRNKAVFCIVITIYIMRVYVYKLGVRFHLIQWKLICTTHSAH